mmetsp:Transcript_41380/g.81759  ORF Transcript_41380/g.81759 Transcript_41380/m.81759 type:complete len:183 (+) Transcript_41380:34-582(+)
MAAMALRPLRHMLRRRPFLPAACAAACMVATRILAPSSLAAWVHGSAGVQASGMRQLATARGAGPEPVEGCETTREVLKDGAGTKVVSRGKTVTVHATGVVKETGKKFWSTLDPGQEPFSYPAGVGQVIKGWDQGCLGMKEGEVRKLVIPAHEGYGQRGFPAWGIPPGGTLEFTLECLKIVG